ncbi:MAG: tetratricopeptide repeat protein [Polyangiaceae bacterium]
MSDRESMRPPSSRELAGEDFLFHLYRGSELLQDNRVHDAKAELEQALSLQPSDPKGQDLLGIVYFRLGMYPRAISIYERLIQMHPAAIEPRINLALSYLKTGQPSQARVELERVLEQNPNHGRAWGYLGLAFQRLGDLERAGHAFAAGGHDAMARRVLEMAAGASVSLRPDAPTGGSAEVRRAAGEAFHDLDRRDVGFHSDAGIPRIPSGTWSAIEPGREQLPGDTPLPGGPRLPSLGGVPIAPMEPALIHRHRSEHGDLRREPPVDMRGAHTAVTAPAPAPPSPEQLDPHGGSGQVPPAPAFLQPVPHPSDPPTARVSGAPATATQMVRDLMLVFPRDLSVAQHASGLVLVQAKSSFAARLDAVRTLAYPAGYATSVLNRKVRGKLVDEPLGGASSPLFEISGHGELVLGGASGRPLTTLALEDEPLYLREELLSAFELAVNYDSGRLAVGDGDAIAMVQLRGPGTVIASLPAATTAIEITEGHGAAVRALAVLGWMGRVVPRALLPSEAPAGARGFVSFSGEGMVLLDAR